MDDQPASTLAEQETSIRRARPRCNSCIRVNEYACGGATCTYAHIEGFESSAKPAADGCRVMCPAPCVVLMRHVPEADAE